MKIGVEKMKGDYKQEETGCAEQEGGCRRAGPQQKSTQLQGAVGHRLEKIEGAGAKKNEEDTKSRKAKGSKTINKRNQGKKNLRRFNCAGKSEKQWYLGIPVVGFGDVIELRGAHAVSGSREKGVDINRGGVYGDRRGEKGGLPTGDESAYTYIVRKSFGVGEGGGK